jgi:hypothetical protein
MCKFRVTVEAKTQNDMAVAETRLTRMGNGKHVSLTLKKKGLRIIAEFVHEKLHGNELAVAAWVKDQFGFHQTLLPGTQVLAA